MRVYFSDVHRFRDIGDYFIAGNNDTSDNLLPVTKMSVSLLLAIKLLDDYQSAYILK
jgi:hypothetical protein